jgi:hypothetical protein
VSWFSFITPRYGIEYFNIRTYITAVFKEPVDVPDIPHEEWECAGVIAGDGLAHINEVWFVSVQYIELAQISMHELCLGIEGIDDPYDPGIGFGGILQFNIPKLGIWDLSLPDKRHDENIPVPDQWFGDRDSRIPGADKIRKLFSRPREDELLFCFLYMREPAVTNNIRAHGSEIRRLDPVDLDGNRGPVAFAIKNICLFSGADGSSYNGEPFLVDEFIEGKERHFVKNVFPNLELVRILDPDPHFLKALIEPILFFVDISSGTHKQVPILSCCSPDIVPYRGKDLNERFTACFLEIHRMNLTLAIGGLEIGIRPEAPVTTEFFWPPDNDLR